MAGTPLPGRAAPDELRRPRSEPLRRPAGLYIVRYTADNLTSALLETMARFRPYPDA
ncbi:MAG: hypothetical protein QOH14_1254 [Pseudonocardiales bacterium]|nr:hypothetical protein [Pseudonocardiales bacterium]